MRVGVIGGGNGGVTAAYHFSKIGNDVCLYDSHEFSQNLNIIKTNGSFIEALKEIDGIKLELSGNEKIDKLTESIKELMEYSKIVVIIVPSFAQEIIFEKLYPYLNNHILVSMPGNFASLVYSEFMNRKGKKEATFVDAISIPWACRIEGPGGVAIYGTKSYLPVGVFPSIKSDETIDELNKVFPIKLTKLKNVIEAGMENINFGGHPLLSVLNMGIMENFHGNFNYYKDTCSKATSKAVAVMEKERLSIGDKLGYKLVGELEAMNSLYNLEYENVYELNRNSSAHSAIGAPTNSNHRYITEDVPYLVVPCYLLGKKVGINSPMMFSCITIAGAYNDENYLETGRNIKKLGVADKSLEEIKEYLKYGNK